MYGNDLSYNPPTSHTHKSQYRGYKIEMFTSFCELGWELLRI